MTKSVFVTATGTDVGKTYVCAYLLKKMLEMGLNCGYYKPVLSGAIKQKDGMLLPGDCDFVTKIAGLDCSSTDCVSYMFEPAVSPHLAAKMQGLKIDKEVIEKAFVERQKLYDYLIVEGAGGITCPLDLEDNKLLLSDIISLIKTPIILVADAGLGTINSVLLSVNYAKNKNINICGVILNNYDKENFMHVDNKRQIEYLTGVKVIACVEKNATEINIEKDCLLQIFDQV